MSEQKHTPRPWKQFRVGNIIGIVPVNRSGKPRNGRETEDVCAIDAYTKDAEGNAALLEAAPDLLHALKELGDWLAHGLAKPPGAQPTAADLAECERLAKQARAAVDRAERGTT